MKLHDTLVKDVIFRLNICLLLVHARGLQLSLLKRILQHDLLLVKFFLFS